jgi:hypothetical protein
MFRARCSFLDYETQRRHPDRRGDSVLVAGLGCSIQHGGPDLFFRQPDQLSGELDLTVHILGQTVCRNDGLIQVRRLHASPPPAPHGWDLLVFRKSVSPLAQRNVENHKMLHRAIIAAAWLLSLTGDAHAALFESALRGLATPKTFSDL